VILEKIATHGKGLILAQGNDLMVENIECRNIKVRDGNGACIRLEGKNLTLNHVYFHDSQEGVLETSKEYGVIQINNSRFERLGYNGQAHGIYTNKAKLYIYQSLFVATKSQGHAIKVRGSKLVIDRSIIASLSSDDSRLIDMPNGGALVVKNSLLEQGPNSVNGQVIGFAFEGIKYKDNSIYLNENLIYLDRLGSDKLLAIPTIKGAIEVEQSNNIIIGKDDSAYKSNNNTYFIDRAELELPSYPFFPKSFCTNVKMCSIK